ncbi:WhiB family transcriptional regulator [Streptomyces nigrescens]
MNPTHMHRATPRVTASNWTEYRACADTDPDVFTDDDKRVQAFAKDICALCPVRSFCLQFAIDTNTQHGVYGGLDPDERDELLGKRRLPGHGHQGNPEPMWQQILRVPERREKLLDLHARGWSAGRIAGALHTNVQTINRVFSALDEQAQLAASLAEVA